MLTEHARTLAGLLGRRASGKEEHEEHTRCSCHCGFRTDHVAPCEADQAVAGPRGRGDQDGRLAWARPVCCDLRAGSPGPMHAPWAPRSPADPGKQCQLPAAALDLVQRRGRPWPQAAP